MRSFCGFSPNRPTWRSLATLVLVTLAVDSSAEQAQARRRVPLVINTGGHAHDLGEIQPQIRSLLMKQYGPEVKVGYVHERFGLFWLDIFVWDGRYAFYVEDATSISADEISKEQAAAALGLRPEDLGPPLSYQLPPGMIVFPLLGCVSCVVAYKKFNEEAEAEYQFDELIADVRYQEALRVIGQRTAQADDPLTAASAPADGGWSEAVGYLVDHGVSRAQAEEHLQMLIDTIETRSAAS